MDIATLLHRLTTEGLCLAPGCIPDTLDVTGPMERLTPQLKAALVEHKPTLLAIVTPQQDAYRDDERSAIIEADNNSPAMDTTLRRVGQWFTCRTHLDRSTWVERPSGSRPGWLTTHCSACGAFIGRRPEPTESKKGGRSGKMKRDAGERQLPGASDR